MARWVNGVEVIDVDPASVAFKAMEAKWAKDLAWHGRLRLGSLAYYRRLEHDELGDKWEGIGTREINNMSVEVTDANEVYVFCAALQTDHERLLAPQYDTIVRIDDPVGFARAIVVAGREAGVCLLAQIGACRYHRGSEAEGPEMSTWASSWNVFEKEPKYAHQCEYRFAFYEYTTSGDSTSDLQDDADLKAEEFLYLRIENPTQYLSIARRG